MNPRRSAALLVLVSLAVVTTATGAAAALPGETPADTFQLNDPRIRTIAVVGDNVWMGGQFTQVQNGNGANVQAVQNLAVLSRTTGQVPAGVAPLALGGVSGAQVWKLATVGTTVYASGKFRLSSGGQSYANLLAFDGASGALVAAFRPTGVPVSQAVGAGGGLVYAGSARLLAFDATTGATVPGWVSSTIAIDPSLRGHNTAPQHRDLQLIGSFLYSACQCDSLTQGGSTRQTKALVRFDPATGVHDQSFAPQGAGAAAWGISVTTDGIDLFLGAGGSDYVARYSPTLTYGGSTVGRQIWKRDTSGSAQAVAVSGSDLIVGGHFVEIADQAGDACGFKSNNPGTLDPNDECITRNRLAAYSLDGTLLPWNPSVTGKYNGVWALALDGSNVHLGGEFKKIHGVAQTNYARLDPGGSSPPPVPSTEPVLTELVTPSPLLVQPNRMVSFTLRCPDPVTACQGSVRLIAGGSAQAGPDPVALGPLEEATYAVILDDAAWNKLVAKANGRIAGSLRLKATGGPGTSPLNAVVKLQLQRV
jgi:hypothetical protein